MNRRRIISRRFETLLWTLAAIAVLAALGGLVAWRCQDPDYRAAVDRQLTMAADWPSH